MCRLCGIEPHEIASSAYDIAEAMISERAKRMEKKHGG